MTPATTPSPAPPPPLTFDDLARLDFRLRKLREDVAAIARAARRQKGWCSAAELRLLMDCRARWLVGWDRADRHPVLGTSEAYDLVVAEIDGILPYCVHAGSCR